MIPSSSSKAQYHPIYRDNGKSITVLNAETRIQQISDLNHSNSTALQKISFNKIKFLAKKFPDKFSQDLADVQTTCEIEKMLINKVLELQKENYRLIEAQLIMSQQSQAENKKLKEKIQIAKKDFKKLEADLIKQKDHTNSLQLKLQPMVKLQKDLHFTRNRVRELQKQIERQRALYHSKIREHTQTQIREKTYLAKISKQKEVELFNTPVENPNIINTPAVMTKALNNKKSLEDHFSKAKDDKIQMLTKRNEKLQNWMEIFVDKIRHFLSIRLEKNQQVVNRNPEITETMKKLALTNNNMICFSEKEEFPFGKILEDFFEVLEEAENNRLLVHKLKIINEAKALDRAVVGIAINQLRKLSETLLSALKWVMGENNLLGEQYEKFIRPELKGVEWVENFDVGLVKESDNFPSKLLSELKKLMDESERELLIRNSQVFQARCVRDVDELERMGKEYLARVRSREGKGFEGEIEMRQKKQRQEKIRSENELIEDLQIDENEEEKKEREIGMNIDATRDIFAEIERKVNKEREEMRFQEEMKTIKTPQNVKKVILSADTKRIQGSEKQIKRDQIEQEMLKVQVKKSGTFKQDEDIEI